MRRVLILIVSICTRSVHKRIVSQKMRPYLPIQGVEFSKSPEQQTFCINVQEACYLHH
uniref:Uncharacterized protein n=1 Tax=Brassica oleracea var. oleracea TaxID=109376 RepID=A0A0D2ZXK9_BRAOL